MAGQLDEDAPPVAMLEQKHPLYIARYETWLDLALLYDGGSALRAKADRVLKKRPREDTEVYSARVDRFTYQNILQTGLSWYGAALFEEPPEFFFNGAHDKKFYDDFLSNCNGSGMTYIDFWKRMFQHMLTFGGDWVLTDFRTLEEGEPAPVSRLDQEQRGLLRPRLSYHVPLDVINWKIDKTGQLEWAVLRFEEERPSFLGKKEVATIWWYYDRKEFRQYEDLRPVGQTVDVGQSSNSRKAKLVSRGLHALAHVGRVPLRYVSFSGGLWLANRVYLLLIDHLNQDNTLAWGLFMSNLAIPVIIGDYDATNGLTAGETSFLQFPSGTEYKWTEPEGKSFIHASKRLDSLREEVFRAMNLQSQGRGMHATPAMQSGRSKILEMAPAKQVLAALGVDVRQGMQDVLTDVGDARANTGKVEVDVRGFIFEDEMTTEELFAVTSLLSLHIPSTVFEKYIMKKVAKAWMSDANRREMESVYKEIDDGPTMDERADTLRRKDAHVVENKVSAALEGIKPPGRGGSGPSVKKEADNDNTTD